MNDGHAKLAESAAKDLGATADALWRDYLTLDREHRRLEALEVLDDFLATCEAAPASSQQRFVEHLASSWLDPRPLDAQRYPPALRFPLLERIVIPRLRRLYVDGDANGARWLGQAISGAPHVLATGLPSPLDLLREAYARDPQSETTAQVLLNALVGGLEYVVHEVPLGLLDTPAETLRDIDDVSALADELGRTDGLGPRLAHWRDLAHSYANFLANRSQWATWADHLEACGISPTAEPSDTTPGK